MSNNKPLISVVMSVYNAELYLDEAIQSILMQTYSNFEFIIIDDGSTDNSLEIIKKYKKEDSRIVLISRENRGLIYSLNEGISLAKGKYIARMDADDISTLNRFKEQLNFMEEHTEIGVCGSWINVFGINVKSRIWKLPTEAERLKIYLLFSVPMAHPSVLIRREIIIKNKLFYDNNFKNAEDYKLWIDSSNYTMFANIPKVLLHYRYLETSISRQADHDSEKRYEVLKKSFNILLKNLNVINTNFENKLHFNMLKNERIKSSNYNLNDYERYILKLIAANDHMKIYNSKIFYRMLSKKYLSIVFVKKQFHPMKLNFKLLFFAFFELLFKDKI